MPWVTREAPGKSWGLAFFLGLGKVLRAAWVAGKGLCGDMKPGQTEPNELELAILGRLARQEPSSLPSLRDLHVLSREYTGVGSFTKFHREESGAEADNRQVSLEALIRMPKVPSGLGAVLFCEGMQADCLEIFAYGEEHGDGVYDGFSIDATI